RRLGLTAAGFSGDSILGTPGGPDAQGVDPLRARMTPGPAGPGQQCGAARDLGAVSDVAKVDRGGLEMSYQAATTRRGRRQAVLPSALYCLAISVSRLQAGEDASTELEISWTTAGAGTGRFAPWRLRRRLASQRWARSASASRRGSSGDQPNAASLSR